MPPLRFRFKDFVTRHSHLLTYAGAVIVFFTFVVKEGLGDHWKQIAEAIDAAQYFYSVHVDMSRDEERFADLRQRLEDISKLLEEKPAKPRESWKLGLLGWIRETRRHQHALRLSQAELSFVNLQILVSKLLIVRSINKK